MQHPFDRGTFASRAEHYRNGRFQNREKEEGQRFFDPFASNSTHKGHRPKGKLPLAEPAPLDHPGQADFTITWFGHFCLLLQFGGKNILVDPHFSRVSSPVPFLGPRRFSPLPASKESLPRIDLCILTHDHFDHLDKPTIRALDNRISCYLVPLGLEEVLIGWGISPDRIRNCAWWESISEGELQITCVPARHNGVRFARNTRLWAGWVLKAAQKQVLITGDTGFGTHFDAIRQRLGAMDFVITDGAQYGSAWHTSHMYPEEAARAVTILGAGRALLVHWGAFVLAPNPWDDPPSRFAGACREAGVLPLMPYLGETICPWSYDNPHGPWWQEIP